MSTDSDGSAFTSGGSTIFVKRSLSESSSAVGVGGDECCGRSCAILSLICTDACCRFHMGASFVMFNDSELGPAGLDPSPASNFHTALNRAQVEQR